MMILCINRNDNRDTRILNKVLSKKGITTYAKYQHGPTATVKLSGVCEPKRHYRIVKAHRHIYKYYINNRNGPLQPKSKA